MTPRQIQLVYSYITSDPQVLMLNILKSPLRANITHMIKWTSMINTKLEEITHIMAIDEGKLGWLVSNLTSRRRWRLQNASSSSSSSMHLPRDAEKIDERHRLVKHPKSWSPTSDPIITTQGHTSSRDVAGGDGASNRRASGLATASRLAIASCRVHGLKALGVNFDNIIN